MVIPLDNLASMANTQMALPPLPYQSTSYQNTVVEYAENINNDDQDMVSSLIWSQWEE